MPFLRSRSVARNMPGHVISCRSSAVSHQKITAPRPAIHHTPLNPAMPQATQRIAGQTRNMPRPEAHQNLFTTQRTSSAVSFSLSAVRQDRLTGNNHAGHLLIL